MPHIAHRTGMYTIKKVLTKFCQIYLKYQHVLATILHPDIMVKLETINDLCDDVIAAIDEARST